jgi:hypothetical protein
VAFDDFDDGDVSNASAFFGAADGGGAGVGPTDDRDGTAESALSLGVNPGAGGGFAGVAIEGAATIDASSAEYFTFYLRPNLQADNIPLTLEILLQEDANGDGTYDGATEDEFLATYRLSADDPTYRLVQIPLAAFTDRNSVNPGSDDGFDFTQVKNVVFAMGNVNGSEFNLSFDELSFDVGTSVSTEPGASDLPDSYLLTHAYPNPFNPEAQFQLTLERSQFVRIEVYDMLGRQVEVLHEGPLAAGTPYTFEINASTWSSGTYLYRVTGESFMETRSVVLLK